MTYNPDKHHRRSIRLRDYDYSSAGAYFVTICTQRRECLFGEIVNGEMVLNDAGRMAASWMNKIESKFPHVYCDSFCIMPNHCHVVVLNCIPPGVSHSNQSAHMGAAHTESIVGADPCVCPGTNEPYANPGAHTGAPLQTISNVRAGCHANLGAHTGAPLQTGPRVPLHSIIQWFKTMTTNAYIAGVKQHGWAAFDKRLWQRNYYERILRNENELDVRRKYIENNPINWNDDEYNPSGANDTLQMKKAINSQDNHDQPE